MLSTFYFFRLEYNYNSKVVHITIEDSLCYLGFHIPSAFSIILLLRKKILSTLFSSFYRTKQSVKLPYDF